MILIFVSGFFFIPALQNENTDKFNWGVKRHSLSNLDEMMDGGSSPKDSRSTQSSVREESSDDEVGAEFDSLVRSSVHSFNERLNERMLLSPITYLLSPLTYFCKSADCGKQNKTLPRNASVIVSALLYLLHLKASGPKLFLVITPFVRSRLMNE